MTNRTVGKTVGAITIEQGAITVGGKLVGRVDRELKHGYHPVVRLRIEGKPVVEYEIDEKKLLDKIFADAKRLTKEAK